MCNEWRERKAKAVREMQYAIAGYMQISFGSLFVPFNQSPEDLKPIDR
jgi:hypothetical protein